MIVVLNIRKNREGSGFTLLELLIVATIMGVLAVIMIPVVNSMMQTTLNSRAENTSMQLKNAILLYFTEQRSYPVRVSDRSIDSQFFSDHSLMDALLGAKSESHPDGLNPKRITYFAGKPARVASNGGYHSGVILSGNGAGELWDPFSEYYRVALDINNDNRIFSPLWFSGQKKLPGSIFVWSAGRDRDDEKEKDNIKTW